MFHSEADFQHAFAWELHLSELNWDLRLAIPLRTAAGSIHLDLFAWSRVSELSIELKYKTRALNVELNGEQFTLTVAVSCVGNHEVNQMAAGA